MKNIIQWAQPRTQVRAQVIEKEINELRQEWAQLRAQLGAQSMNNNLPQSELLQKSGTQRAQI